MTKHKYAAKIALINEDGQTLMLRNSATHDWAAGKLDLPGGVLEAGESPAEAVVRETKEEVGVTLSPDHVVLAYSSTQMYQGINYILFLYVGWIPKDMPITLNFEHDTYEWYTLEDALQEYDHPAYHAALQYAVNNNLLHS